MPCGPLRTYDILNIAIKYIQWYAILHLLSSSPPTSAQEKWKMNFLELIDGDGHMASPASPKASWARWQGKIIKNNRYTKNILTENHNTRHTYWQRHTYSNRYIYIYMYVDTHSENNYNVFEFILLHIYVIKIIHF